MQNIVTLTGYVSATPSPRYEIAQKGKNAGNEFLKFVIETFKIVNGEKMRYRAPVYANGEIVEYCKRSGFMPGRLVSISGHISCTSYPTALAPQVVIETITLLEAPKKLKNEVALKGDRLETMEGGGCDNYHFDYSGAKK